MMQVNTCDVFNPFQTSQTLLHYCTIPIYKNDHTLIHSISAPLLTTPHPAYSLILPKNHPPTTSMATTDTSNTTLKWLT